MFTPKCLKLALFSKNVVTVFYGFILHSDNSDMNMCMCFLCIDVWNYLLTSI